MPTGNRIVRVMVVVTRSYLERGELTSSSVKL